MGPKLIHVEGTYTNARPPTQNIVTNGDFETAPVPNTQGNWQVVTSDSSHSGTVTQSPDAHTGSYSGAFTVTANPPTGGFVALSESTYYWAIGQSYTLTFYYKSTLSSCYASAYAKSQATTVGNDIAYWMTGNLPATNTWTLATLTFGPIPEGTVDLQIHFEAASGVTGILWVDDVSTVFSANTVTPTPTQVSPSPAPSTSTTATPTEGPTITPTPTASIMPTPTANPTTTTTGTANPTTSTSPTTNPTGTQNPDPTQLGTTQPSASTDATSPPQPEVPELTIAAVAAVLLIALTLAIFARKTKGKHSGGLAAATLSSVLLFSFMPCAVYAQTTAVATATPPVIEFSLWYTNGTAFPTGGANANGYVNGGPFINIGGIHCIASGFGSSADKTASVVVLRNDGNVPINVKAALKNAVAPSNIQIILAQMTLNNSTYSPYSDSWFGRSNVGGNPLAPGQCMWLALTVSLGQTNVPLSGTPNYDFNYRFDIEVTATQA